MNDTNTSRGFSMMEMMFCLGIASSWILLGMGLIGSLQTQVEKQRLIPHSRERSEPMKAEEVGLVIPDILDVLKQVEVNDE